jgi:ABC-2 type transport system ATP-binding protein
MKIITGYMAPTDGVVTVAGYDVFENPIEVKKRIGYLPENPPVYMDMLVKDYLEFVANLKGCEKTKIPKLVDLALQKTNLTEVSKRLIQNLSKGFRQRVGIAQALVSDPEILILDEPTVGLDPKQVAEIRSLLKELKGHHTVILSTHILPEVQASCEKVIIINEGRIVAEDTIQHLAKSTTSKKLLKLKLKRKDGVVKSLGNVQGVKSVSEEGSFFEVEFDGLEETIISISSHVVKSDFGLLEMSSADNGLEDVFIQLTTRGGK